MSEPFDDFDGFASEYRAIHDRNLKLTGADSYYFAEKKIRLLGRQETNRPLRILDVGCGDGAAEIFMAALFPLWKVDGIDISEKSIAVADRRDLPNARFRSYDGRRFPFDEASFDIVYIAGVLHHLDPGSRKGIIAETHRVLAPGGRLYVFEHNCYNPATRYLVRTCVFDKHAKLLSARHVRSILREEGFIKMYTRYTTFFPVVGIFGKLAQWERRLAWLPLGGQYYVRAFREG